MDSVKYWWFQPLIKWYNDDGTLVATSSQVNNNSLPSTWSAGFPSTDTNYNAEYTFTNTDTVQIDDYFPVQTGDDTTTWGDEIKQLSEAIHVKKISDESIFWGLAFFQTFKIWKSARYWLFTLPISL